MTHTKFIELLNLYLDHEITANDAVLLEGEIARSTERARIYREYAQMHQGCSRLSEAFATETRPPENFSPAARRTRHASRWYLGLGAAAAACAAFALVSFNNPAVKRGAGASQAPTFAARQARLEIPVAAQQPVLQTVIPAHTALNSLDTGWKPSLLRSPQVVLMDWASGKMDLRYPTLDELNFQVHPFIPLEKKNFRGGTLLDGQVEMTAFQFQR